MISWDPPLNPPKFAIEHAWICFAAPNFETPYQSMCFFWGVHRHLTMLSFTHCPPNKPKLLIAGPRASLFSLGSG